MSHEQYLRMDKVLRILSAVQKIHEKSSSKKFELFVDKRVLCGSKSKFTISIASPTSIVGEKWYNNSLSKKGTK